MMVLAGFAAGCGRPSGYYWRAIPASGPGCRVFAGWWYEESGRPRMWIGDSKGQCVVRLPNHPHFGYQHAELETDAIVLSGVSFGYGLSRAFERRLPIVEERTGLYAFRGCAGSWEHEMSPIDRLRAQATVVAKERIDQISRRVEDWMVDTF